MQAFKNNYEKIILGLFLVAFVASGFYWVAYLKRVGDVARSGDLIRVANMEKKLDRLQDSDFLASDRLSSSEVIWGTLDGKPTGNLFRGRSYMSCANSTCQFWIAYGIKICPHCKTEQGKTVVEPTDDDTDKDGIPDLIENQYDFLSANRPRDAFMDQDADWFINVEEHKAGTAMDDPADHPPLATRLRLVRTDRDLFGILLDSVMAVKGQPKETWDISLKVREGNQWRSRFTKLGKEIAGYKIVDVEEKYVSEYDPAIKDDVRRDVSTITISRDGEDPMVLTRREKRFTGVAADAVLEISRTENKRVAGLRDGKKIQLRDSLGRIENYVVETDEKSVTVILIQDGVLGPNFVLDRTRKIELPRDTMLGGEDDIMGMPYPETGGPDTEMMYNPRRPR